MNRIALVPLLVTTLAAPAAAQTAPPAAPTPTPTAVGTSVDGFITRMYPNLRKFLIAAVAMMPEDDFTVRPSPDARTFGEAVAHIGASNYAQCRATAGTPLAPEELAALKTLAPTKAALTKLIDDGFKACDTIFEKPGEDRWALTRATMSVHSWEMYGTLAVYLRMKGLVPPSTQRAQKPRGQGSGGR